MKKLFIKVSLCVELNNMGNLFKTKRWGQDSNLRSCEGIGSLIPTSPIGFKAQTFHLFAKQIEVLSERRAFASPRKRVASRPTRYYGTFFDILKLFFFPLEGFPHFASKMGAFIFFENDASFPKKRLHRPKDECLSQKKGSAAPPPQHN